MKSINRILPFCIFLFFAISSLNAATITWLGGNGAWGDTAQWDTGSIPTFTDDVIIPSGSCKLYSAKKVRSVVVQSSAKLYIYSSGNLRISGAVDTDGIHNLGKVFVYGTLDISNISQANPAQSAKAIKNEKKFNTYPNGKIIIAFIDDIAISNEVDNAYFNMKGSLSINNVDKLAISNFGNVNNYGTIDIENSGESNGYLILNVKHLTNFGTGIINLNSEIYGGISNPLSTSKLRNFGNINIEDVNIGVHNDGLITNYLGATFDFLNLYVCAYRNMESGIIDNYGFIQTKYCNSGMFNYGLFSNHNSFAVFYGILHYSLKNFSTGIIDNYDYIYLNATGPHDLYNEGEIINHNTGYFEYIKNLTITASGVFSNHGFWISSSFGTHQINGTATNDGFIDDNFGMLQGSVTNNKVIVSPVSGPMQVGVPYPNVLDVASLTDVSIGDWITSPNGAIAGTYDVITNEFTPNASSVGLSTIYVVIEDLVLGNARNVSLEIDAPIVPFTKKSKQVSVRDSHNDGNADLQYTEVNIYPNPTSGIIQLESEIFDNTNVQIYVYNSIGKLVQKERLTAENTNQIMSFSDHLNNGLYFLIVMQNGQEINVKRVLLER